MGNLGDQQLSPSTIDPNWYIYVAVAAGVCCCCCLLLLLLLLVRRKRRQRDENELPSNSMAKGVSGIAPINAVDTEMASFEVRSTRVSEYGRLGDMHVPSSNANTIFYASPSIMEQSVAAPDSSINYASARLLSDGQSSSVRAPVVYASGFGGGALPDYGGADFVNTSDMGGAQTHHDGTQQGAGLLFTNYGPAQFK